MQNLLKIAKIIAFGIGFLAAVSLVRAVSQPFDWYAARFYDWLPNMGFILSLMWFAVCLVVMGVLVWQTKLPFIGSFGNPISQKIQKWDFSALALICAALAWFVYQMALFQSSTFDIWEVMFVLPLTVYIFAMFAFTQLIVRLRDNNLGKSLYWLEFFQNYPIWQPLGFFTMLLLASQIFLMFYHFSFQIFAIRLIAMFAVALLTYFAAFLQTLSARYTTANEEKIRSERFKTELITNVSHDIKTPLTSIINYVDLLQKQNLQGKSAEYLKILEKKSARLKTLIDDLMAATKASTGNLPIHRQEIDFKEIVGQIAGEFEDDFLRNNLTLVVREPQTAVIIQADNRHLFRVLENVFSNAAKYSLNGTRVFAEISHEDGRVKFILRNTASQPIEPTADLTEQFIRGDKARQTDGNGLGLYIAKSLIELMGGGLQVAVVGDLFGVEILL
ncbi:MAG: HAMP domain-containing histidine kinase [Defluviitaleaceae bacterium]|nr:HAMP domain-containing histidine kinase [Defluviitaleaceae bacterium]